MFEGLCIKPNMVTPGSNCKKNATPKEIAYYTVRTLQRTIPSSVPGITFLSGGQSEDSANSNLSAMNKLNAQNIPWNMTFSFGRALVSEVLEYWAGDADKYYEA